MALEGAISQHSYNGKEAYSYLYTDNEPPFSDLQAALCFLDNQTDNYDSTFHQAGYYENTTTFLHQPPNEIVVNEEKPTANCDISFHGDMGNDQVTRRRTRAKKNKEEISNQRMTHIAVERNRRRQMNEYLSILRSLMPESYVQRCDQASTVGGAINFIKELEHRLHLQNISCEPNEISLSESCMSSATPFCDTFKDPQFSMGSSSVSDNMVLEVNALADIEVSLVQSHATLKIRSRRRPKILLKLVSGLQSLGFIILHLNVSTVSDFVLYCFSTKMEDCCKLSSVTDIATAVYEMLKMHNDS